MGDAIAWRLNSIVRPMYELKREGVDVSSLDPCFKKSMLPKTENEFMAAKKIDESCFKVSKIFNFLEIKTTILMNKSFTKSRPLGHGGASLHY